ncbi:MAG: branched-chain amino acid ABC transporter permease, partial [Chloroflexota bacterium]
MTQFLVVTLNGLTLASLFFIVASGFSLIFGLMRVVNMAHGALYMVGAYVGWSIWDATGNWWAALILAPLAAAVIGIVMQRIFLRPVEGDDLREALVTIAISIIIADLLLQQYGGNIRQVRPPEILSGAMPMTLIGLTAYPKFRLFTLFMAILVGLILWYVQQKT